MFIEKIRKFIWLFKKENRYLFSLYRYDMLQYLEYSCLKKNNSEILATKIRLLAHALEKGLSLPKPKKGFGKEKVLHLIRLCDEYASNLNHKDKQAILIAEGVISAYIKFQKQNDFDLSFIPIDRYNKFLSSMAPGGVLQIDRSKIVTDSFERIAFARHSLRYFSDRKITEEDILKVVRIAQTAPSACNRQPIRVFACIDQIKIDEIIKHHGGIRGFGKPTVIFVIAGDLSLYQNEYERNTVFIDAGLFSMNLLYSLESCNIASCPIIWGSNQCDDVFMNKLLGIPDSHKICILIAAGYFPGDKYNVAASIRRPVEDILHII